MQLYLDWGVRLITLAGVLFYLYDMYRLERRLNRLEQATIDLAVIVVGKERGRE